MTIKSDIEIAQEAKPLPITDIADACGMDGAYIEQYGRYKAKIDNRFLKETNRPDGKLVLVTAITPTPAGEGKTTTTVGLADGLRRIGRNAVVTLREPSLGPVFGIIGAAPPAAAMPRWCLWRTSISTSPGTFTPSARPTTCWRRCWTTTSSRVTPWGSTSSGLRGGGVWI